MGSLYPKGNKIYLSFQDASGKWRARSSGLPVGEEKRAMKMLEAIEGKISAGARLGSRHSEVTVEVYAAQWIRDRESHGIASAKDDESRIRLHILPEFGSVAMTSVRPHHLRDLVRGLRSKTSAKNEPLAPRSIRHVYAITRRMFQDAVVDELIDTTPCVLKQHDLPKKIDKDPTFRANATFTRDELVRITTDRRVPDDRRMLYGLMGIGAMRFGEAAARRWRDYDTDTEPLGRMVIASSFDVKSHREKATKTQSPRAMPVHQTLCEMLMAWKEDGWAQLMSRRPNPDDLIVPSVKGRFRNVNHSLRQFHKDLDALGFRRRRQHDLRRTFITLARAGGARPDILRWATHGPTGDIVDIYTSMPWESLCEAVAYLKVDFREAS